MFKFVKDVNNGNTGNAGNADTTTQYLPGGRNLKKVTDCFSYSARKIWNSIPADAREADSLACFETCYVKWFLNKQ